MNERTEAAPRVVSDAVGGDLQSLLREVSIVRKTTVSL